MSIDSGVDQDRPAAVTVHECLGGVASGGVAAAPGAAAVVAAMAGDAAATLALGARSVAHTAAYYGCDVQRPEEEMLAMLAMSFSVTKGGAQGARAAAFTSLSKLTQQIVRGQSWKVLSESVWVRLLQQLFQRLGIRLTQRKLGQAIPVLGIVLGAGMNYQFINEIADGAELYYRHRLLTERGPADESDLAEPSSSEEFEALALQTIDGM